MWPVRVVAMDALLVCDDAEEAAFLSFILNRAGATCRCKSDLEKAIEAFAEKPADLVVLSLREGLPTMQVRRVRRDTEACLAVISSTSDEDELCQALEAGADLVLVRPYSARLVCMQLRALLRRSRSGMVTILPLLTVGKLVLDPSTRVAKVEGSPSRRLTPLEFRLLYTLMLHRGQTLPNDIIVERVWGYSGEGSTVLVRGLIRRLRAKVERDPRHPQLIALVPGVGYRLDVPEE